MREDASGARRGSLWTANLDGSNAQRISPEGVEATLAGATKGGGGTGVYYVSWDGDIDRSVWMSVPGSTDVSLASFQSRHTGVAGAVVSPDGRFVAHSDGAGGVWLLDLDTGAETSVLDGTWDSCETGGPCYAYDVSSWSPDGGLLMLEKRYYEGGDVMIVDPFTTPVTIVLPPGDDFFPSSGAWSPDGDAICAWGQYGAPSGIYVANAPDWTFQNLTPQFEQPSPTRPRTEHWVSDCDWLDSNHIAFAADAVGWPAGDGVTIPDHTAELGVLEAGGGSYDIALKSPRDQTGSKFVQVFALGDSSHAVWTRSKPRLYPDDPAAYSAELVDLQGFSMTIALGPSDRVVAVLSSRD